MPEFSEIFWLSLALAICVPLAIGMGFWQRISSEKGMGWQFIRVIVLSTCIPIIGVPVLNSRLTSEASTLLAAAMGFAFGKSDGGANA